MKQSAAPIARGTLLGSLLGLLPGNGAVLGPFASYTLEKKLAQDPSRFGRGAIEGVAGPESANNAGAQTAFIPLLTLGIPPNAVMALMVGAMTIHGIVPGPQIMTKQPQLFWGMIASMWLGNLMLLIINLPLIGLWVRFLKVPYRLMFPSIVLLCCIGIYSINNSPTEVIMTAAFGLFGYALVKFGFEPAPLLLGFVLGRLMEEKLRQALVISRGTFMTFVERPLSGGLLLVSLVILVDCHPAVHPPEPGAGVQGGRLRLAAAASAGDRYGRRATFRLSAKGIAAAARALTGRKCWHSVRSTRPGPNAARCAKTTHFSTSRSRGIPRMTTRLPEEATKEDSP